MANDIEGILAKCDVVLDMNDPDFVAKLRAAIVVGEGEDVEFVTPQFKRTDGLIVPIPLLDFAALPTLAEETLKAIGCQKWDDPDADGKVLWLYPAEWYSHIPDGHMIESISGKQEPFIRGETDDDMRFGALAYGFRR